MSTLREIFASDVAQRFQDNDQVSAAALISRSLAEAFSRDDGNAIVVHYGNEVPEHEVLGVADRKFNLRISFIGCGEVPEAEAEAVRALVHPIVMAYTHDAVIDILDGPVEEPKYPNGDLRRCKITMHYVIWYRTQDGSLTG